MPAGRGLKRFLFTLPGIPVRLMARVVDWLTPVPYAIAVPLVGGLQSDSVVLDEAAQRSFPEVRPITYEQAVTGSLAELNPARLQPVWEGMGGEAVRMKHEGFFVDYRCTQVNAPAEKLFGVITSLGRNGNWLYASWLWRLRGWIDGLISPPRTHRNTRAVGALNTALKVGDEVGYYRVEQIEENRMLRLHSELRAPGEGWMEWQIQGATLKQTAYFAPRGLPGFVYWHALGPLHRLVFRGLIRAMKQRSEELVMQG